MLRRNVKLAHSECLDAKQFFSPLIILMWKVQSLWALLTVLPSLAMIATEDQPPLDWRNWAGWSLWLAGLAIETCSKSTLEETDRDDSDAPSKRIACQSDAWSLWSVSRYPNYSGELFLWTGLYLAASSVFSRWWYVHSLSRTVDRVISSVCSKGARLVVDCHRVRRYRHNRVGNPAVRDAGEANVGLPPQVPRVRIALSRVHTRPSARPACLNAIPGISNKTIH